MAGIQVQHAGDNKGKVEQKFCPAVLAGGSKLLPFLRYGNVHCRAPYASTNTLNPGAWRLGKSDVPETR